MPTNEPPSDDGLVLFILFAAFVVVLILYLHNSTGDISTVHCPKGTVERKRTRTELVCARPELKYKPRAKRLTPA